MTDRRQNPHPPRDESAMPAVNRRLERIVVGTSLDEASDPVIRAALDLADRSRAEVFLVHGFPLPVVYGGGVYGGAAIDSQLEADRGRYRQLLDEQLARIGATADDFAAIRVELDAGYRLLHQAALDAGADLVVVGASEARGPLAPLLGSTADRLLRRTHRPVLVVRHDEPSRGTGEAAEKAKPDDETDPPPSPSGASPREDASRLPPRRVLAAVDLSALSEHALRVGLQLLGELDGPPPAVDVLFVLSRIDREGSAHFEPEQVDRFATEELEGFVERVGEATEATLRPVLRSGSPREEILHYLEADGAECDLVLLGTHGRSGFERFLLGSVANEILRRVKRHCLVVPPAEAEEAEK